MSLRECAKCGGKKAVIKTEIIDDTTVRSRKCRDCKDITRSYENESKPIFSTRETELIEEYRNMAPDFKKTLRSFIRFLKNIENKELSKNFENITDDEENKAHETGKSQKGERQ